MMTFKLNQSYFRLAAALCISALLSACGPASSPAPAAGNTNPGNIGGGSTTSKLGQTPPSISNPDSIQSSPVFNPSSSGATEEIAITTAGNYSSIYTQAKIDVVVNVQNIKLAIAANQKVGDIAVNGTNQVVVLGKGSSISHVISLSGDNNQIWIPSSSQIPADQLPDANGNGVGILKSGSNNFIYIY